jgi:hypothetical protein
MSVWVWLLSRVPSVILNHIYDIGSEFLLERLVRIGCFALTVTLWFWQWSYIMFSLGLPFGP